MSEKFRLTVALIAAFVSTALAVALLLSTWKYFDAVSDLPEYVVAGHLVLEGRGVKLYDAPTVISERKKLFPTLRERPGASVLCPPPAFPLFLIFTLAPPAVLKVIWTPILALAACASILLLRATYGLNLRACAWLWAATFALGPLFEAFKLNQISTFLLLGITSSLWLFKKNRDYSAGAVLAIFLFKPQELVTFMFFLMGAGKWRAIQGFAAVIILCTLLSLVIVGPQAYGEFFTLTRHLKELSWVMQPEISPTLRGQLVRLHLNYDAVQLVSLAVLSVACAFSSWLGRKESGRQDWLELGTAVVLPIGLTTAMLCHFYDLILLVPCAVALINSSLAKVIPKFFTAVGLLVIMSLALPVALPVHYGWVLGKAPINPYALLMMAMSTFLAVFAIKAALVQQQQTQPASAD